jgi:hypothetical protein
MFLVTTHFVKALGRMKARYERERNITSDRLDDLKLIAMIRICEDLADELETVAPVGSAQSESEGQR